MSNAPLELIEQVKREAAERVLNDWKRQSYRALYSVCDAYTRGEFGRLAYERADDCSDKLRAEIFERAERLYRAEYDLEYRQAQRERARLDRHYFYNAFTFQWNVKEMRVLPFVLYDRQAEIVDWLGERYAAQESGLLKKSREFGLSCLLTSFEQHNWIFSEGFYGGFASRKQEYLYKKGNWKSLLEKFIFSLERLPHWLRPRGFARRKHVTRNQIVNPVNSNLIDGEAGEWIGSGGRATMYVVDEFSLCENQARIHQSLSGTSDCVIYVYTSKGPTTYVRSRLEKQRVYPILVSPWYHDPRKVDDPAQVGRPDAGSEWAEQMRADIGEQAFLQEFGCVDDLPEASGLIRPSWITASQARPEPAPFGIPVCGLDLSDGGNEEHVLTFRQGPFAEFLGTWTGLEVEQVAQPVMLKAIGAGARYLFFDNMGRGARFAKACEPYNDGSIEVIGVSAKAKPNAGRRLRDSKQRCARRFANKATELYWALMLAIKGAKEVELGAALAPDELIRLPRDGELETQLVGIRWEITAKGIKLQDKRAAGKSPDRSDSLALTFELIRRRSAEDQDALEDVDAAPQTHRFW